MVLVRRLRSRGANIVVEAHGEVLFAASGDVGRWTNRFSQRVRSFTAAAAPGNKRPRWSHYGAPLKSTFRASTSYHPARFRVYSAVGSTAPHSAYVDQGTGIYAGNAPYEAAILPPWSPGSGSLYERTWRPPGSGRRVAPVLIKGQRGQFFFDEGLKRGFQSMRMRSFQLPGEGASQMSNALNTIPDSLLGFLGNTPSDGAFRAQLEEWRSWRDEHFNSGRMLGRGNEARYRSELRPKATRAASQRQTRTRTTVPKAKAKLPKPKPTEDQKAAQAQARRSERNRFLAAMMKKYGASNVDSGSFRRGSGYLYVLVRYIADDGRPAYREVRGKSTT